MQYRPMDSSRLLLLSGVTLLSISALLGFVQERHRESPETFARWRVVHAGGAAGAVQLIALAAVWSQLTATGWRAILPLGRASDVCSFACVSGVSYRKSPAK